MLRATKILKPETEELRKGEGEGGAGCQDYFGVPAGADFEKGILIASVRLR